MVVATLGLGRWTGDAPSLESTFDPMELLYTRMPFVDPFGHDFRGFQASSCVTTDLANPDAILGPGPCVGPTLTFSEEPSLESLILLRTIIQGAATNQSSPEAHADWEVVDRIRLTPDQAISIFNQRKNKTKRTASLLSAKYGVSSKAIRDIWTGRTWHHYTRP